MEVSAMSHAPFRLRSIIALGVVAMTPSLFADTITVSGSATASARPPAISQASIDRAIARLPQSPAVRLQQSQGASETSGRAFLKSPKGLAMLAVLGAGAAYAGYSKVHDRVHSKNPDR
jgi:hypothetical protein